MSFFIIEDFLILDEGSEVLKKQFENHCEWCWGMVLVTAIYVRKHLMEFIDQLELKN